MLCGNKEIEQMHRTEYDHLKRNTSHESSVYAEAMYAAWLHHRDLFRELPEGARQRDVWMTILCEQCAEFPCGTLGITGFLPLRRTLLLIGVCGDESERSFDTANKVVTRKHNISLRLYIL